MPAISILPETTCRALLGLVRRLSGCRDPRHEGRFCPQ